MRSFAREQAAVPELEFTAGSAFQSPFVSVYERGDGEASYEHPAREAYAKLVHELHDEEFDEALFELMVDARGMHQAHLAAGHSSGEAERLVTQHFSELGLAAEAAVDALGTELTRRNGSALTEGEVDTFIGSYGPPVPLAPSFENFFGKLLKKVGRAAKAVAGKAWQGIKKVGLGLVLSKLKALLKPLLNRVLQQAIGKLPGAIQPAAQQLAAKLGFASAAPVAAQDAAPAPAGGAEPAPDDGGTPVQEPAGAAPATAQEEFDRQIAEAMLADDEAQVSLEIARLRSAAGATATPVFSELDDARARFIQELSELGQAENPEPYVQNFLPAVLPALKVGLRLIGRPRVVSFLGGLLAKLITNLIGPAQAPALSKAIVDAGLKLLNLEMSEQEQARLGPAAVAATVEETINRVASLPDQVLDNPELLEGFALEAFEQAAAANLPAVLSDATYRQRPELLEAGLNAGWVLLPLRRPRYKRCTRSFKIKISPHLAEEVESFEGTPLSEYLQDQLGLPEGTEVEAEMHLYEALPGTTIDDVARHESTTPGLGASDEATLSQLHPLTREAAGRLLGRPGLGRAVPLGAGSRHLFAGQRLYHLAIAGRRPLLVLGPTGGRRVRRLAHLKVLLDATADRVQVSVFMSEAKAQRLALRLRDAAHAGSLAVGFHKFATRRLGPILHGRRPGRLRVLHPNVAPGQTAEALLQRLPAMVPRIFVAKLRDWLVHGFSEFTKTQSQHFLTAAQDPADGITLRFSIEHPQGLKELLQSLVEKGPAGSSIADALGKAPQPEVRVEVFPGHRCD